MCIPFGWGIEAFYQVFPVSLPQAAGTHRTATNTLHKRQKEEAEGCMLEAFGGGTEEEELLCRACLQLCALQ